MEKINYNSKYELKHISIRVPWHDKKWNGSICDHAKNNSACLVLKNCSENRDDQKETTHSGKYLKDLAESDFPPCVVEGGMFMSSFPFTRLAKHPYAKPTNQYYKHLKPTHIQFPIYSVPSIPFQWMIPENSKAYADEFDLDLDLNLEPNKRIQGLEYTKNWIQDYKNQKAILDCFYEHIDPLRSLCFLYAKEVPFVEESGRVLIGIGKIHSITQSDKYPSDTQSDFNSMPWEHIVSHSIRSDFSDGFLFPYHEALDYQLEHHNFDPAKLAVIVPDEFKSEFSYKTEHVSHDSALLILRESYKKIELAKKYEIGKDWDKILDWLHTQINLIERLRGDYPGLGSVLSAFGFERGHFLAQHIFNSIEENECPWEFLDTFLKGPKKMMPKYISSSITDENLELWESYKKNKIRINLLQLLSRFQLSIDQAIILLDELEREKEYKKCKDEDILSNPYIIYEISIQSAYPISFYTIDIGLMTNKEKNLLPDRNKHYNSLSKERIRALTVYVLEGLSYQGHTLYPESDLIQKIKDLPIEPSCNLNSDYFNLAVSIFGESIQTQFTSDDKRAYQLNRYVETGNLIHNIITKRINGKRHLASIDYEKYLNAQITFLNNEEERLAKKEKLAALKELFESRISVLIGQAGSGKTTLLSILASIPDVQNGNVLFLAPTGKARVRMEEHARQFGVTTQTIAQFLFKSKRFKGVTQTYQMNDNSFREGGFKTIVIDECSMLTEEMLAATLQNLDTMKIDRIILVGDYRQLPPIGAGRPFFDIIQFIKPTNIDQEEVKVKKSYIELTVATGRQVGMNRLDKDFATLFSGKNYQEDSEQIISNVMDGKSDHIKFYRWENESEFEKLLFEVLEKELSIKDEHSFNKSLGSQDGNYFNFRTAVNNVEDWQILSPVKSKIFGTVLLNRLIHKKFKAKAIDFAYRLYKTSKPMGSEEVVYGDKIINLKNESRDKYTYPSDGLNYIANGEVGIIVGKFANNGDKPFYLEVEFSSQKGYKYQFKSQDFSEELGNQLELAYSLTVHKAQGSQFKTVILVIPQPCTLLSRELIYTAITRQMNKVIILCQGHPNTLLNFSSDYYSNLLQRITNLFYKPNVTIIKDRFFEKGLIHSTSDGKMVRSKSELLIYEMLINSGIFPEYEHILEMNGEVKRPDFYIEDGDSGTVYIWEHLGMLQDKKYEEDWKEKLAWYKKNDILPYDEGGGSNGTLIISQDELNGSISLKKISELIHKVFKIKVKSDVEKSLQDLTEVIRKLKDDVEEFKTQINSLSENVSELKQLSKETDEIVDLIYKNLDKTVSVANLQSYYSEIEKEIVGFNNLKDQSKVFLSSAYFLKEKLDNVNAEDYSPFVLQFSRAIENEILVIFFISFLEKLDGYTERESLLNNELTNPKTSLFAGLLKKRVHTFTLGQMQTIFGFIWKEEGETLNSSPLLQIFRKHVLSISKDSFLNKEMAQTLNKIASDFRNKSAHIDQISKDEIDGFLKLSIGFLNFLLGNIYY